MKKTTLLFFMALFSLSAFAQLPLESFEGSWPPAGWGIYDNGVGTNVSWVQATGTSTPPHTGTYAAYMARENVPTGMPEDWLVTPRFTVPLNAQVKFWTRLTQGGDQGTLFQLRVSTDPVQAVLGNYSVIKQWTETELNLSQTEYVQITQDIPPALYPAGTQVYVAFVMLSDNGDRWLVDDVMVISKCLEPTNLSASNFGLDSATLTWNANGATQWEIEIVPLSGAPTGNYTPVPGTSPTYNATGLLPDTDYKYYVRAICSPGNNSINAGPYAFSTVTPGATCAAPKTIASLPYSTTDNTSNYGDDFDGTPGSSGCNGSTTSLNGDEVVYAYTATFTGTVSISMTNNGANSGMFVYTSCNNIGNSCAAGGTGNATTPVNIPNFSVTNGQTYYIVISTSGTTQSTPYTLLIQQVNCAQPVGQATTNINATTATLNWTNPSGATSWEVAVQPGGQGVPSGSGTTVTSNTYNAQGLSPATLYEYWVRADCGNGTFSAWAGPYTFTTTQIPATLNYSEGFEGTTGWTLNNGTQTNKWAIGSATSNGGTKSLYISNDGGASNAYTTSAAAVVQAYRDIQIPAGANQVSLQFDWKGQGESTFDYLRVWAVPASFNPTPGTQIAAGTDRVQLGGNLNLNGNWTTATYVMNVAAYAGQVRRIVFEWRDDTSGGAQPPTAIDNVNIALITCPTPSNLALGTVNTNSATLTWTASGVGTPTYDYYLATNTTAPTASTTPTGNVSTVGTTINDLQPSTAYNVWIRANCGPGDTSFWIGPLAFNTTQIPGALNYYDDFEGPVAWTLNNGTQTNKWVVGTATSNSPTHSLYISNDNGATNSYATGTTTVVQAYRDVQLPATTGQISVQFDWKAAGESTFDYIRVWMVPVTFTPTPGTQIAAGADRVQLGGNLNQNANWTSATYTTNAAAYAGQARRLVFEWRNDGSGGTQPPAAIDNVAIGLITCPAPTALTLGTVGQTSATFSWTAPATPPASYDYYISTSSSSPSPTTLPTGNVTTTTATPNNLNPSTSYYVWVRSNCGPGDTSFWIGPLSFNTTQIPATLNWTDDFEGPISWSFVNGTQVNKWVVGTATSNSPTHSMYISNNNGVANAYDNGTSSVTQAYRDIAIPAGTTAAADLSFDWKAAGESTFDYMRVWIVPATFTPTAGTQITAGTGRTQIGGNYNQNTNWTTVVNSINLATYAGTTIRLVFEWRNDGSLGTQPPAAVDNVSLIIPTCPKPTNLAANGITQTGATLSWSASSNATSWEVYVVPAGSPSPTAATVGQSSPATTFPAEGLQSGTQYVFYVRSNCGATDGLSGWAGPFAFTTRIANDECSGAIPVTVNSNSYCQQTTGGTLSGATASSVPNTCAGTADDDVWFEFTATQANHYIALLNASGNDMSADNMVHAVYSGQCGALTLVYCSDDNKSNATNLVPGQTYKIRVYSNASTAQNFQFRVCVGIALTCADAQPFCANNTQAGVSFPGSVGVPQLGAISCLATTPNPTYYFLQVLNPGTLALTISQTNYAGNPVDVDFVAYGPFADLNAACSGLTSGTQVGCSYSTAATESFTITNAPANAYYMVLITNFSEDRGTITFNQTNIGQPNAGTSNCTIVCTADLGPDQVLCGASSVVLDSHIINADSYTWKLNGQVQAVITGGGGQTYTATQSGTWTVEIVKAACSNNPTDSVDITFLPTVDIPNPADVTLCGTGGTTQIDLTTLNASVLGSLNPANYVVEYYTSLAAANAGLTPINTTTPFTTGTQTIYVRVEQALLGSCFDVAPINIIVNSSANATITYPDSPFCSNEATGAVTLTGNSGGTYSSTTGLAIDPATGAINIGYSTPGTYTVTYDIAAAPSCPAFSTTASVTIVEAPTAAISYDQTPYCSGSGSATVTQTGTMGGTYSSTAGLVIDPATGAIDLATSTPGDYVVSYTIPATADCAALTVTTNVTINLLPAATISYADSPFCSNETTGVVTQTGNTGGVYSSTAGLTIDPATGAIDIAASTAGTYTVTYTLAATASCPEVTTTATVTIVDAPTAAISYDQTPYCSGSGSATVTQTGTMGGTYSSTAGLVIDPATGAIDLATSTPGDYVVSYTIPATADCAALTVTTNVTINLLPAATISYADSPFCSNETTGVVTQTGNTGGVYSSTAGLTIDPATGAIDIAASTAGTYTVTYTLAATASCPEVTTTASVTIVDAPTAAISYDQTPYCSGSGSGSATVTQTGTMGGTYSSTAGLVIDPATGAIDLATSTPGDYVVSYTIPATADCAALTVTTNVTINLLPAATISYADSPFCSNETTGVVTQTGNTGGVYSSTAGLTIDPATGAIDIATSTAGTYTVTYTLAATASCPEVTTTASVTIVDAPTAAISYDQTPYCSGSGSGSATVTQTGTMGGTYSSTAGLVIDPATGAIDLATSTPGDYVVSYTIPATADCAALTVTTNVTINLLPTASISYVGTPFCSNGTTGAVTFAGTTGGTYSSSTGLAINASTGEIDLTASTPGSYTVTYTIAATASCPEVTATANIVIEEAPAATIAYAGTPYCSNEGMAAVTLTGTTGGTFSSTAGLVINATTGEIDLAASTAGTYTVAYDIPAGISCAALHETTTVEITTAAAATISYATPFCSSGGVAGVTFTGTTGGTYSSAAGLNIDPVTGTITPSASTPGSYTVSYTLPAVGGCSPVTATFDIVITPQPSAEFTYDFGTVCQNFGAAIPTFDTGATAGTFTVSPATGLSINPATGVITTATSAPGTYVVTNTIAAAGGCGSVTDTFTITIDPAPVATFNYGTTPEYCNEMASAIAPTLNGTAGTFTVSPATGLSLNAATGEVNIAASTPGTYTVTNTLAGTAQCPGISATATITIKPTPQVDLGGPYTRCAAETITVTADPVNFTGAASYAWTLAGNPIGGNSATVDVNGYGTLEVTVTVNGCTRVQSVAVTPSTDVVEVVLNGGCDNGFYKLSVLPDMSSFDPATSTYSWSGPGGFTSSAQSFTAPATGIYNVTVTTADGCTGTGSFTVDNVQCMIQKGISPGDGDKNETFDLTGFNVSHLSIFNRYGKEVFSMSNYTNQWHGQESNGNDLPTGTYFYSMELANGENKTGWIYINRAQ